MSPGEGDGAEIMTEIEDDGLDVSFVGVEGDHRGHVMTAAGCNPDNLERRCPVTCALTLRRSSPATKLQASPSIVESEEVRESDSIMIQHTWCFLCDTVESHVFAVCSGLGTFGSR